MLKIERLPSYLSPSSLMQAENMPNTFYMTRLISEPLAREPQSLPAAIGSAFDYYIKQQLVKDRFPHKTSMLPDLLKGIETNISKAMSVGKYAFGQYNLGAYDKDEFANVEIHLSGSVEGVEMMGKLDATVFESKGSEIQIPFDWKVTGWTSGASPHKYYYRAYQGVRPVSAHKLYTSDVLMKHIDERFTTQLATYGWLMGFKVGEVFPARIDELVFRNKMMSKIAKFRGWIDRQFQEELILRYQKLWKSLEDESFLTRLASKDDENLVWFESTKENWY